MRKFEIRNSKFEIDADSTIRDLQGQSGDQLIDLSWIDEFIQKAKPYMYVRELDKLLILIPNQAYRLNDSAVTMLQYLMSGNSINDLLLQIGDDKDKRLQINYFFCDLRAVVRGCLCEHEPRQAVTFYEFNGDFNEYPVLSEIAVTYRCNLNCDFCYVGDKEYKELSTSDVKKILFKILREAQIPSVSFTGGEPLMRNDIVELVAYASGIGMWTNLITNGTLLDPVIIGKLRNAGLSSAQVSLEGADARMHDALAGCCGAFEKTVAGIRYLQDAGIPVHTNTTVSRYNLPYLKEIVRFVKKEGLSRLSMNLCIPCGAAVNKPHIWVSYEEIGDHIKEVKHFADNEGLRFMWYSPVPVCMFNPIAHGLGNKSCAAITGLLSIDPQGNIIPCSSWRMPVASLLRRPFQDIWESEFLAYFKNRDYAPEQCRSCVDLDLCKGACPLYWQTCGKKELDGKP
jgi:radical SAM protein with 4Fe4S-binding SPASM domain